MDKKMEEIVTTAQEWAKSNRSSLQAYGFIALGLFLLYLTFKVIINMLLFTAALFLIYDGCKKLNCQTVTSYFEKIFAFIQCNCGPRS